MVRALDDGRVDGGAEQRLKVPPNSIEAEQSLIGGLMLNAQAWDKIADRVSEEDFYRRDHRLIFNAIGELAERGQPCDAVTVSEFLSRRSELEGAGGPRVVLTVDEQEALAVVGEPVGDVGVGLRAGAAWPQAR